MKQHTSRKAINDPVSSQYRLRKWYDQWLLLFRGQGTIYPRAFLGIAASVFLCWVYIEYARPTFMILNPTIYSFFLQTAGLILAFAVNMAYTRFWESITKLTDMSQYLLHVASMVMSFDKDSVQEGVHSSRFHAQVLHVMSIFHAVAIQNLLTVDRAPSVPLEVLGGLTKEESSALAQSHDQPNTVFHWMNVAISNRHLNGGIRAAPPIAAQIWAQMNLALLNYAGARRCAENRLPISLQQSLGWSDLIVLIISPICIAAFAPSLSFALVLTGVTAGLFHGIFLAVIAMQQPFGRKRNDLPLILIHQQFIDRLLGLAGMEVAEELGDLYAQSHDLSFVPLNPVLGFPSSTDDGTTAAKMPTSPAIPVPPQLSTFRSQDSKLFFRNPTLKGPEGVRPLAGAVPLPRERQS